MKASTRESNQTSNINRKSTSSNLNSQSNSNQSNSNVNLGVNATTVLDHKTFVKVVHADNKIILLNSLCSCLHMLNYLKEQLNINKDELIDLIDFDGNLKEIPNLNNKEYAIQFLVPTTSYAVLKIDLDTNTNEKRYTPILNENRLTTSMIKTLTNLNTGRANANKRLAKDSRLKSQVTINQSLNQNTNSSNNLQSQITASSSSLKTGQSNSGAASRKTIK